MRDFVETIAYKIWVTEGQRDSTSKAFAGFYPWHYILHSLSPALPGMIPEHIVWAPIAVTPKHFLLEIERHENTQDFFQRFVDSQMLDTDQIISDIIFTSIVQPCLLSSFNYNDSEFLIVFGLHPVLRDGRHLPLNWPCTKGMFFLTGYTISQVSGITGF